VLYEHAAIAEVAVIGLPNEQWGEAVVAVAVLKSPAARLELEALRAFASERLAHYKLPTRLEWVSALPRTPSGKVLKYELRARFGAADRPIG
jgi:fatty-acyl-CoA synthase